MRLIALLTRPFPAYSIAVLLPLLGAGLYMAVYERPLPESADEYGYLLAADTFASGRLTNPQHPHWWHFESYHVFHEPTYMTKYPPGQGAFLALGQLAGDPLYGVWLGIALMTASLHWMLSGFLPRRWALLGTILAGLNLGFYHYWSQSFWGGALAAAGGALVLGGVRRLWDRTRVRDALICGTGILLLFFTRPFEGAIFCLVPATLFLIRWHRQAWTNPNFLRRAVLPIVVLLFAGTLFTLYYNYRLTGSPLQLYYTHYEQLYPGFNPLRTTDTDEVEFRHPRMQRFLEEHILPRREMRDRWWRYYLMRSTETLTGMLGPILPFLLLLGVVSRLKSWASLSTAAILAVSLVFLVSPLMYNLHYMAPITSCLYLLSVRGIRRIWLADGARAAWGRPTTYLIMAVFLIFWVEQSSAPRSPLGKSRQNIEQRLSKESGNHLVIVHYRPDFRINVEYVYNLADIDAQPVVWAQDMGDEQNQALLTYYDDRTIWLLTVGAAVHRLERYADARPPSAAPENP